MTPSTWLLAALLAVTLCGQAHAQGTRAEDHRRLADQIAARFDEPATVETVRRFGAIALIRAEFTTRANSNEQYLVRDRSGALRMVAEVAEAFRRDAEAALAPRHADAAMWPATQAFLGTRITADGQVTLRFALPITDACRACAVIGVAQVALDFDAGGAYRGARLLRAAPLAGTEAWDRGAVTR
ncbi:hypothetical protein [Roseomonas fluvialis]|uniref:Uncharacterized protein n=1 Tax=Roseomonas fluvialis TaxID=1750527 RepID=A0ABM7Y4D5_9PROT|nr:hypothetical protein [Roseomonas fluvialis]BDG72710.1 hypothetical protein Rmf_26390 [Roseomonas fluvialis]